MDGQWSSGNPQTDACAVVWTFEGDAFDLSRYCALDNGLVGLEINRGTFIIAGDQITLTKTRSTCPGGTREAVVLSFIVERQKLTLVSSTMVYTLAKGGLTLVAGSQASFGCFDATGGFTASCSASLLDAVPATRPAVVARTRSSCRADACSSRS